MTVWLPQLAEWLREAGLRVQEQPGWETNSRNSGGWQQNPLCVVWHHTASPASWDGQRDADYCAYQDPNSPVGNLYIDRTGLVWVNAGGAANTNGTGQALTFSRGTVPMDQMNTHSVAVEMGNDGIGEPWPQVQIDAMFLVSNTVNRHLGNQPEDLTTHAHYAPSRKIDPATSGAVQGPWEPRSSTSSGTWDVRDVQAEARRRFEHPQPPTEDDDMASLIKIGTNPAVLLVSGTSASWVKSTAIMNELIVAGVAKSGTTVLTEQTLSALTLFGAVPGGFNASMFAAHFDQ